MAALKHLVLLLTLFCSFLVGAQGEIRVMDNRNFDKEYRVQVERNDSLCFEDVFQDSISIRNLKAGNYVVYISQNDEHYITFHYVDVKDEEATWLFLPEESYREDIEFSIEDMDFLSFHLDLLYGPKSLSEQPFSNQSFELRASESVLFPISRNFLIGIQNGLDFRWSQFDKDTNALGMPPLRREHYFGVNYLIGTHLRFFHYKLQDIARGPLFDIGVNYALPIAFRHVYLDGNQKIITRKIHQWNDLSVYARLGYAPIAVIAEYRLFDTVRGPFSEMPKFRIGISMVISGPNYD